MNDLNVKKINEIIDNNPTVLGLVEDVGSLKKDMAELKEEMHFQGIKRESLESKVEMIVEAIIPMQKDMAEIKIVMHELREDIRPRVKSLEYVVKKNVTDKDLHKSK